MKISELLSEGSPDAERTAPEPPAAEAPAPGEAVTQPVPAPPSQAGDASPSEITGSPTEARARLTAMAAELAAPTVEPTETTPTSPPALDADPDTDSVADLVADPDTDSVADLVADPVVGSIDDGGIADLAAMMGTTGTIADAETDAPAVLDPTMDDLLPTLTSRSGSRSGSRRRGR